MNVRLPNLYIIFLKKYSVYFGSALKLIAWWTYILISVGFVALSDLYWLTFNWYCQTLGNILGQGSLLVSNV
jgi:hypothetical protein